MRIDSKQAFLSDGDKLAVSAVLSELESYQRIKSNPDDAHAHLMVGLAYLGKGVKDSSIEHLQRSLQLFDLQKDKHHVKIVKRYLRNLTESAA